MLTLMQENPGGSRARLARALAVTAPNIAIWSTGWRPRAGRAQRSGATPHAARAHTTPRGTALVRAHGAGVVEGERAALDGSSAAERAMLVELLHKVACAPQARARELTGPQRS